MDASFLDRAIGYLSPRAALRREAARRALGELRGYDAAKRTDRTAGWRRPSTSARAEVATDGRTVRDSARDLVRNNPFAAKIQTTLLNHVVGDGIVSSPRGTTAGGSRRWRQLYSDWQDECDWEGLSNWPKIQELSCGARFESGDALVRLITVQPGEVPAGIVPLKLQVLELDFLDAAKNGMTTAGGEIDRGIEYDAQGRRVAYWLYDRHPGDVASWRRTRLESRRVPVSECLHLFNRLRPGQDRGISHYAPAVMTLYDLKSYFDAELVRKRIESCLSVFVTTDPDAVEDGTAAIGLPSAVDNSRRERLAPGIISYLRPGEDVSVATPAGGGGIGEFARVQLQAAAAAAGVMYEQATGDFSGTNYSSYRAGNFDFRRMVSREQWLTIEPMLLGPVVRAFARHALVSGLAPGNTMPTWSHEMPEFISVDPKKDAEADQLNMRLGKLRPSQLIGRTGYNFEEHLEGWSADLAAIAAVLGDIKFDGDPRKSTQQKGQSDASADPQSGADQSGA